MGAKRRVVVCAAVWLGMMGGCARTPDVLAQTPRSNAAKAQAGAGAGQENAASQQDSGVTQEGLMRLLQLSPTLADVLSRDPSLLSDSEYIGHTNPELAQYLQVHPEVVRNPGFYLFSNLRKPEQRQYSVLEPKRGFEDENHGDPRNPTQRMLDEVIPVIVFVLVTISLLWLIRLLLDNRRWVRTFKLQSEVHGRLIEKFASSQELLGYMDTEVGKRFLEATPIITEPGSRRLPQLVSRMLSTLQIGTVLTLLGIGLIAVKGSVGEGAPVLLIMGVVALMPGLGLILSAGITWILAKRLGLLAGEGNGGSEAAGYELREPR